jgi:hypothetical protein
MEFLPASQDDSLAVSLKLVERADIYILILGQRYGHIPPGSQHSITELEYQRAAERGIPRLVFIMHEDHPIKARDFEQGEKAIQLQAFKRQVEHEQVRATFTSSQDLRSELLYALLPFKQSEALTIHHASEIPLPPKPYVAHPYTLLQTSHLAGRTDELSLLSGWINDPNNPVYGSRIFNIVAIGGMGKSALAWKWFNYLDQEHINIIHGRLWWSFYESDATFENFVIRALSYVTGEPKNTFNKMNLTEREDLLLSILNERPFLLVLDGLERVLVAYARWDAARLMDDDLDNQTANRVAGALGLPPGAAESFTGKHLLRKAADPRAGNFLRRLANCNASRTLITTRLYPADLQAVSGQPIAGSSAYFLLGLKDEDALGLWRDFGVGGSNKTVLTLFRRFNNYPLLIRALAGEVANYRKAPGDFDQWHRDHPGFQPFQLPLVQIKSHVLAFALLGMDDVKRRVLQTISGFRMPTTYMTLSSLLVRQASLLQDEKILDSSLTELEDRGLIGWDRLASSCP